MSKKTTKRALAMSFVSVFLCVCMLVGTTFAWFTDETKSAGNTIQAGNLDVVLEKYTNGLWEDAEGETIAFRTHQNSNVAAENIRWEPGCTFWMESIRVKNAGNLALKYAISLASVTGGTELMDALEFTYVMYEKDSNVVKETGTFDRIEGTLLPNGDYSGDIILKVHMKEDAGNEYMNKKLENVSVVVSAQQLPYEYDSVGNQYDALTTALKSTTITGGIGQRTQIGIEIGKVTNITDKNNLYIDVLDQYGNVITKVTPTDACFANYMNNGAGFDGLTASCVVCGGDSSSWDNTAFVPTTDKIPTTAVLYVNGVETGRCAVVQQPLSWQQVVDIYDASVNH